jgi:hypothetical protein
MKKHLQQEGVFLLFDEYAFHCWLYQLNGILLIGYFFISTIFIQFLSFSGCNFMSGYIPIISKSESS